MLQKCSMYLLMMPLRLQISISSLLSLYLLLSISSTISPIYLLSNLLLTSLYLPLHIAFKTIIYSQHSYIFNPSPQIFWPISSSLYCCLCFPLTTPNKLFLNKDLSPDLHRRHCRNWISTQKRYFTLPRTNSSSVYHHIFGWFNWSPL